MNRRPPKIDLDGAEWIAIHGLSFLANDAARLGRFLSLTGVGPSDLQHARQDPGILAAVLEYLLGDEPLLLEFAANSNTPAENIQLAWDLLTLESHKRKRGI